jgi:hypothetical protein
MFDARSRCGDTAIALLLGLGNTLRSMPSVLDVDAPASLLQVRFSFNAGIAAVGMHVAAVVVSKSSGSQTLV